VGPQLDRVLYATHVFDFYTGPMSLDIDLDGSVVVGLVEYNSAKLQKVDSSGRLTSFSFTFTDPPPTGGRTAYDARWIGVALAADHSVAVAISPMFLYRVDAAGKQILSRVSIASEKIQLTALCVDAAGNAYVAGSANDPLPVPATHVDYTSTDLRPHSLVMKFDRAGNSLYTAAFGKGSVTALVADVDGAIWGAGSSTGSGFFEINVTGAGIDVFQLNPAGSAFLHYLTIPSDYSVVNGISIDNSGRPLLAGSTASFQLPDTGPARDRSSFSGEPDLGAFLMRIKSNPAEADLGLSLTSLVSAAPTSGSVTYLAMIANVGTTVASDVRIVVPGFVSNLLPSLSDLLYSCRTTGNGTCTNNGGIWKIAYPLLAPGESETVQFLVRIPSRTSSPFPVFLSVETSADDRDQSNNNAYIEIPVQTAYLSISTVPGIVVEADNGDRFFASQGIPALPGTNVNVFVPSPQFMLEKIYEFAGWSDGSFENPRSFTAGQASPASFLNMRLVTEPWVDTDAAVQHAGSYRGGAVAAGEILTPFGYNLGPAVPKTAALDEAGRIATRVNGFQVLFDGVAAPVVYTSARQSSVIVPYAVAGKERAQMVIQYNGLNSTPVTVAVTDSAPGLLTANYSGSGQALAFNSDGSLNSRNTPVRGGDIVVLYGSGEGDVTPSPLDGEIAGASPSKPKLPVSVTIGGQPAEILYAGGVSGVTAGLLQLNVRVPVNAISGLLPVLVTVGSNTSQRETTIAVQ
jgi:uncharacterized protein (TIGR03437 family)